MNQITPARKVLNLDLYDDDDEDDSWEEDESEEDDYEGDLAKADDETISEKTNKPFR